MNPTRAITLTWNCCPGTREPDWGLYDALELAGCVAGKGWVERVEEGTTPSFYTVYGHLVDGGCEALHDWPWGFLDLDVIRQQCDELGERLGFTVWDMA